MTHIITVRDWDKPRNNPNFSSRLFRELYLMRRMPVGYSKYFVTSALTSSRILPHLFLNFNAFMMMIFFLIFQYQLTISKYLSPDTLYVISVRSLRSLSYLSSSKHTCTDFQNYLKRGMLHMLSNVRYMSEAEVTCVVCDSKNQLPLI